MVVVKEKDCSCSLNINKTSSSLDVSILSFLNYNNFKIRTEVPTKRSVNGCPNFIVFKFITGWQLEFF